VTLREYLQAELARRRAAENAVALLARCATVPERVDERGPLGTLAGMVVLGERGGILGAK